MIFFINGGEAGGAWTQISYDDFESGWGNWIDGGSDALLYTGGTYAHQGSQAADLQDNNSSSVISTQSMDLSGYDQVKIDFWYFPVSFDNNREDFWVQISTDGGATYTTKKAFVYTVDFTNGNFYYAEVIIDDVLLTDTTRVRFRCDASGNYDDVYLDEIRIWADGTGNTPPVANDDTYTVTQNTSGNILTVRDNDTDVDGDDLTITHVTNPPHGTATTDGFTVTYTPDMGYDGPDSLDYTIDDGNGGTDIGTANITVDPLNHAPSFTSTPCTGAVVDQMAVYRVTAEDSDGDPITITGNTPPWMSLIDNGDGTGYLFGTPAIGDLGPHAVELTASDGDREGYQNFNITVATTGLIPQGSWTLAYVDSDVSGYTGDLAFDGDPDTMWHTRWDAGATSHPHEIQIDLGATWDINGLRYLPRQDVEINGTIWHYEIYVSTDGNSWGAAVATGEFTASKSEQEVLFATAKSGQYIRLVAQDAVDGNIWTSVAEINLLSAVVTDLCLGNEAPNGEIIAPANDLSIPAGTLVSFSGTGTDPEDDQPITYSWDFDSPLIPECTQANCDDIEFATAGTYVVSLTVADGMGTEDPTPATRTITVASTATLLDQSLWSLHWADSEASGYTGDFAFDGDSNTIWHTAWEPTSPPPPHEIRIDLNGVYDIEGVHYLPRQDMSNGRIGIYEIYVSGDGATWGTAVAWGTFPDTSAEQQVMFTSPARGRYIRLVALTEVNGNPWTTVAELNVAGEPVVTSLEITPTQATVAAGGTVDFDADLGVPPYTFGFSANNSGGTIDPVTGFYTAGATTGVIDIVNVTDSQLFTVSANVQVIGPAQISPTSITVSAGAFVAFNGIDGLPPFIFQIFDNQSGGTIDPATGLYEAGAISGVTDIVRMTDAELTTSDATVSIIGTPLVISPKTVTVSAGGTVTFSASGGIPPYVYSMQSNPSGGSINANSGIYTAGNTTGVTDSVKVIDNIGASSMAQVIVSGPPISQAGFTTSFVSSYQDDNGLYDPENAFDGDPSTYWHTRWSPTEPSHPHEIQINLGGLFDINGFRYLPRQLGQNGRIGHYEFYVSVDGINWGEPVASGFFDRSPEEQNVNFATRTVQYVRLVALDEIHGYQWTSVAELNILGEIFSGNYMPESTIDTPVADTTIMTGDSVDFAGTVFDPESTPMAILWDFGDGRTSTLEDPGMIAFMTPGVYEVMLHVTDQSGTGRSDATPGTRIIRVLSGSDHTINRDVWNVLSVSSEELAGSDGLAENAIDGNTGTIWHTEWFENTHEPPHEITFDMGSAFAVEGLRYLPRQDYINGRIQEYRIFLSEDGKSWGISSALGTFADDYEEKQVLMVPEMARFIKIFALNATDGYPYIAAAEVNVNGVCEEPYVRIIDPQDNDVQQGPNLTVSASVCLNGTTHSGWGVKFKVDGIFSQVVPLPGDGIIHPDTFNATFAGLTLDNHFVEAVIVDDTGIEVPGSMGYDSVSNIGIGDAYVAVGNSITTGYGDDIPGDNTSIDGRSVGGGYPPVLADLLFLDLGYPVKVATDGVGGEQTEEGLARLPSVLNRHVHAGYYLIMYGTNDSLSTLSSGLGLSPGDSGYAGSYKDFMQQMIDLVINDGKTPYLAKLPWADTPAAASYAVYNQVVDELVTFNGINVVPPDFYSWFEAHPYPDEMADALHPNGKGYQSMADLWYDAIMNPLP